jgi:hypothetical protein
VDEIEKGRIVRPSRQWLRTALVVVALIELLGALSSVHNIFTDYHRETAHHMRTSDPAIFAVGDVAEYEGTP